MLTALRSKTGGIVAKAFIGLLAASFAVWGISDVFRGSASDTLATVGEHEITVNDFQETFRNQLNRISRQVGKPITPDEARQMGIDRQILAQLIQSAALDEQLKRLKIDLSDEYIARRVAQMKEFQGLTGQFDVNLFRQRLGQWGISEARFIDEERSGVLRAGLMAALTSGLSAPEEEVRLMFAHRNAARDVSYFRVPADSVTVPEPDEKELKAFYESHKNLFALPERRQLFLLTALPQDLTGKVTIDEAAIREYYDSHKSEFGEPEKRTVEQITFASEKEAKAALEKIRSGKARWEDIAGEKGLSEADRLLGSFTKSGYPDPALADKIFALEEGEVSEPLKGALSISLARVTKVQPASIKPFEAVKEEIARKLKLEKAKDVALELHDKVEDARASGQSLQDIAGQMGLKGMTTPHVSAAGLDKDGKPVKLPAASELLKAAFASDVGVDNDVITTPDDGFVWFAVTDIKPASVEKFEQARDKARKEWERDKRRQMVMEKANKLLERARKGEDMAKLAAEVGAEVRQLQGLKRNEAREDFPVAAVRKLFAGPENAWLVAPASDGVSALLVHSTGHALPPLESAPDEVKSIRAVLAQSIARDVSDQYLAALQKEYGVKINRQAWARLTGGDAAR